MSTPTDPAEQTPSRPGGSSASPRPPRPTPPVSMSDAEFEAAAKQTRLALEQMQLPCLDYFMEHFLDSFRLTLDELE